MPALKIAAKIHKGLSYKYLLPRTLPTYNARDLERALGKSATFFLEYAPSQRLAVSWWGTAKRTRTYPYARVYDTLNYLGRRVTIIPIYKDEGKDGDRDYLEFDTVSLMSLLQVYTIISYYVTAEPSRKYANKITKQRFNIQHVRSKLDELLTYQHDPLHWNLAQLDEVGKMTGKAIDAYSKIAQRTRVVMHSADYAIKRRDELLKGKDAFINLTRSLARAAQARELVTRQPKEQVEGDKSEILIENYLGGVYHLTADEAEITANGLIVAECKNTKSAMLPSWGDIKDGLLKMVLFTNLEDTTVGGEKYKVVPMLKLTSTQTFAPTALSRLKVERLKVLEQEARENGFTVLINGHAMRVQ